MISVSKFKLKGFSLHFYDFVFVARDADIHDFLIGEYTFLLISLLSILVVGVVVLTLIWKETERRASSLRTRLLPALAVGVALPFSFPAEAAQNRYFYYLAGRHASASLPERLDIGFLSTVLIQKAGLPTSAMFEDLVSGRDACHGRFHACDRRDIVDRHLRKRVDSGLLNVSTPKPVAKIEG